MVDVNRYFKIERDNPLASLDIDPEHAAILRCYGTNMRIDALINPLHPAEYGRLWVVLDKRGQLWYYRKASGSEFPDNLSQLRRCTEEESFAIRVLCAYGKLFYYVGPCGCNLVAREHPRPG